MVGGDIICNNGEIMSSTKELVDKCLAIDGEILWCQVFKMSIFSAIFVRYLDTQKQYLVKQYISTIIIKFY